MAFAAREVIQKRMLELGGLRPLRLRLAVSNADVQLGIIYHPGRLMHPGIADRCNPGNRIP